MTDKEKLIPLLSTCEQIGNMLELLIMQIRIAAEAEAAEAEALDNLR